MDKECTPQLRDIVYGTILTAMWFLRLMLALAVVLLIKDSRLFPLLAALILMLFIFNGAFITGDYNPDKCVDVNFFLNAGYCFMPAKPLAGWLLAFSIASLIFTYFTSKKELRLKEKEKKRERIKKEFKKLKQQEAEEQ